MKWIGQHIYDLIARFRSDIYLEDLAEQDQEFSVMVDADGKLTKSTHPGERSRIQVRNDEGSTISAGAPLYSKGEIGSSERILVGICVSSDPAKMPCIGVAEFEMNTSDTKDSFAVTQGVYNTNISGFTGLSVGDTLYVNGGVAPHLTQTKPTNGDLIQNVGIVLKTNGTICQGLLVSAIGRTNDVPWPLYVDHTTQRVGIGVTNPSEKLEVVGNISASGTGSFNDITIPGNSTDYYIGGSGSGTATNTLRIGSRTVANTIAMELFHATNPVSLGISYSGGNAIAFIDSVHSSFDSVLQFKTGGSERFRIGALNADIFEIKPASSTDDIQITDDSGNAILYSDTSTQRIGIGTTSPAQKLHVVGDARIQGNLTVNGTYTQIDTDVNTTEQWLVTNDGTGPAAVINQLGTEDIFDVQDDGTSVFYIEDGGNIGIGTTSPSAKLHVLTGSGNTYPTASTNANLLILENKNAALGHSGLTIFSDNGATGNIYFGDEQSNQVVGISCDNTGGKTDLFFTTNGSNERMRIDGTGNVGIGTTSPSEKLEVDGNVTISGYYYADTHFQSKDSNATLSAIGGGGVYLRPNGAFSATGQFLVHHTTGNVDVSGNISIGDGKYVYLGDDNDLRIIHSSNSFLQNFTGDLYIENAADDKDIIFNCDDGSGGVTEYFRVDGGGELTFFTKPIQMTDNAKIFFGVAGDLELYHDGTDSYVKNDTGDLYIQNTADDKDIIFQCDDGSGGLTPYLTIDGSAVANKFSEKVQIYKLDATANPRLSLGRQAEESINFDVEDRTARIYHKQDESTGNHVLKLTVDSDTSDTKDIHLGFRDADGSNESIKFTVDESGNVGIGTTDPSEKLHVAGDIKLSGNLDIGGSVQKQIQVFPMNFVDDLGTDKHFMPFVTANEQTANYQEEACMVMPADGRVVSVTVHYTQMHGAASDITVGIETSPCGQSYTNAWTIEETETISASADDDHHVFHFAFDNAKHFESTDKMALSIQQSVDLQNAGRFFWVTAVIEYDWSTFLGGTSAEYTTTP